MRRRVNLGAMGQHLIGKQHRSARLGYDCYTCGPMQGQRSVKCQLALHRLPPYVSHEIRPHLPLLLMWPEENHAAAHTMVDAVLSMDVEVLQAWRGDFPDHAFGYEQFLSWCLRATAAGRKVAERTRKALGRADLDVHASARFGQPIASKLRIGRGPLSHDATVAYSLVRFANEDAAIQVKVYSQSGLLLSKAFTDLIDGSYLVTAHYPGRYAAEGVPESLLTEALGTNAPVTCGRVGKTAAAAVLNPLGTPESRTDRVQAANASLGGVPDSNSSHLVSGGTDPHQ